MMLYKLGISNIKKSFRDYAIYFFTLILGVCIFYVFNSIDSQTAMLKVSSSTSNMIELIKALMNGVSIFVSFVLGFLIIYASRFLIKKRYKEFGIYMTLGMPKRKISKMLLIETFLIGVISLVIGLVLGVIVSQVTSIFIADLFDADMTKYTFNFSISATIKTLIYFGIIYLIVMLFNTVVVSRCKLIDLLTKSKKNETIKVKKPVVCILLFVISIILLGSAYYMVTDGFYDIFANKELSFLLVPILMGGVGTILFFYSLSGMFLRIITRIKKIYYRELNTFIYKELSSQINTMVISLSVICIMIFLTICTLSSALTIKDYFNESISKYAPADITVSLMDGQDVSFNNLFEERNLLKYFDELVELDIYFDDSFTYKESLGNYYETLYKKYPYITYDTEMPIMKLSDYNKICHIMKLDKINLKDNEYAILNNYEREIYENVLKLNSTISILGYELEPGIKNTIDGDYNISSSGSNVGTFIVPDYVLKDKDNTYHNMIGKFNTKDINVIDSVGSEIFSFDYQGSLSYTNIIEIKENAVGLKAMATFIGIYLGIIFLISSAAILSLKSLSDAIDDRDKYKVLRNIGADEKYINKALFKQTLIFFMLPLLLAIVHTIFGIKFCLMILESIGIINMTKSIVVTGLFIVFIYGGYFILTYLSSKNIIKNRI